MSYERDDCRLCHHPVKLVLSLEPTPIANLFPDTPYTGQKYPLELKECSCCGHVQIGHIIEDEVLYGSHYKYQTPDKLRPMLEQRARELRAKYPKAEHVLEIGANNAIFMDALGDAGFPEVGGVDPSGSDFRVWKMPFDHWFVTRYLERIGSHVDLIVANNVFAHIDNLDEIFEGIDRILSPNGALIFEVQYLVPMVENGLFDMIYHEHRDYHTVGPLVPFLHKYGLTMTDYKVIANHGGSLQVTARRTGAIAGVPDETIDWLAFQKCINAEGERLRNSWTGKIPAFGAPAKATTIIHQFRLEDRISYCVDDTPEKQGKFIAGTCIPVIGRDRMLREKPERMLLLSWNYEELIKQSVQTQFLVPFKKEVLA